MSTKSHDAWGVRGDETLAEHLRLLSGGFHDGTDTQKVLWAAANEIERLGNEISNGQPAWIPVSERMPERYQCVLVATETGIVPRAVMAWSGSHWTVGVSDTRYDAPIAKWMPLPGAPKS